MIPDPLIETNGPVDSLTLERAFFHRRLFSWKEGDRRFIARYSWNADGRLTSREEEDGVSLYAYDERGLEMACYHLDRNGLVSGRETREWDDKSRLIRRVVKTIDPPAEESWTYEHDNSGRMSAERRGKRVRVEKKNHDGRIEQEYIYDGDRPDLITDFSYDESGALTSMVVKDPEGTAHRHTRYTKNSEGRLSSVTISGGDGRIIRDETYAYGASHGNRWLERVTWIPDGGRKGRRRPREVIYRSFTIGGIRPRTDSAENRTLAFANGVYIGPVLGEKPEGIGVFQYNDESRYEGEFRDGAMSGKGRLTWPDGREMNGFFSQGLLEGDGECFWADGSRYAGRFRNGRMHGPGVFTWADGTRFEGLFEKGRRTDQGTWERPEDRVGQKSR